MARPLIEIKETDVEKLASMGCNNKEIAAFCECSVDTLERRFADVIAKGREKGKAKLRRLQWQAAEKGNVVMLIWLGKQLLGQAEKQEIRQEIAMDSGEEKKQRIEALKAMVKEI